MPIDNPNPTEPAATENPRDADAQGAASVATSPRGQLVDAILEYGRAERAGRSSDDWLRAALSIFDTTIDDVRNATRSLVERELRQPARSVDDEIKEIDELRAQLWSRCTGGGDEAAVAAYVEAMKRRSALVDKRAAFRLVAAVGEAGAPPAPGSLREMMGEAVELLRTGKTDGVAECIARIDAWLAVPDRVVSPSGLQLALDNANRELHRAWTRLEDVPALEKARDRALYLAERAERRVEGLERGDAQTPASRIEQQRDTALALSASWQKEFESARAQCAGVLREADALRDERDRLFVVRDDLKARIQVEADARRDLGEQVERLTAEREAAIARAKKAEDEIERVTAVHDVPDRGGLMIRFPARWSSSSGRFAVEFGLGTFPVIESCIRAAHAFETGGILVGIHGDDQRLAHVVAVGAPPVDSEHTVGSFVRGTAGVSEWLQDLWRAEPRAFYLGDWHSRTTTDVEPSDVDVETMRDISTDQPYECPEPILLIVGRPLPGGQRPASVHVFDRNGGFERLSP